MGPWTGGPRWGATSATFRLSRRKQPIQILLTVVKQAFYISIFRSWPFDADALGWASWPSSAENWPERIKMIIVIYPVCLWPLSLG